MYEAHRRPVDSPSPELSSVFEALVVCDSPFNYDDAMNQRSGDELHTCQQVIKDTKSFIQSNFRRKQAVMVERAKNIKSPPHPLFFFLFLFFL